MKTDYSSNIPVLGNVLLGYAQAIRKPLADVMEDQASKLCSSNFGDGRVGLFQEAAKLAPQKQELFAIPILLKYHIRRRNRPVFTLYESKIRTRGKLKGTARMVRRRGADGKNIKAGEIERRAAARFYHASGWLNPRFLKYVRKQKLKPNGAVVIQLTGNVLSVEFVNPTRMSEEINRKHGDYVSRALRHRVEDMLEYINRHLDRVTVDFNSRRLT